MKYVKLIILAVVLFLLLFFIIPVQEKIYFQPDLKLLQKRSDQLLIGIMVILAVIIFLLAARTIKKPVEVFNILLGITGMAIPFYFLMTTFFLSVILFINSIDTGRKVDKKYIVSFFRSPGEDVPIIYDPGDQKKVFIENIPGVEHLQSHKTGDTIVISFHKGLLGFNFSPAVKNDR